MKRFVVIGLGNFGATVARALHGTGNEVIAIDTDGNAVDEISPHVTHAAVADGRDMRILDKIGARDADVGVVSTGDDITASILGTLALKDLGVGEIFVKVISHDHARVLEKIGVTETIFPERESGIRLATRVSSIGILNYVKLGAGFGMQEMAVPENWIGQTLRQLQLPVRHRIGVIAVHDILSDEMIPIPDPDAVLKESDTLLVAGKEKDLEAAARIT